MKPTFLAVVLSLVASSLSAAIAISTISPAGGLTRGGEIVHIHGTGFTDFGAACINCFTTVEFGGVSVSPIDYTASELVVVAPPHAAGPVDVVVNIKGGTLTATVPSGYNYQEPLPSDQVRLLVPIAIGLPGALGTTWQADLLVYNGNSEPLSAGDTTIAPFTTGAVALTAPAPNIGTFLYVPKLLVDNVTASLRVHDTTHDADSQGAEIPVVPETQFRRSIVLAGIPNDSRYRTLLRVYSYGGIDDGVSFALRDDATGEWLASRDLPLQHGLVPAQDTQPLAAAPLAPAYGQMSLDSLLAPFAPTHARIRAEIASTNIFSPPIWAFVSITNNVTQQVTVVTPGITPTAIIIPTPSTLIAGHYGGVDWCADVTSTEVSLTTFCTLATFAVPAIGPDNHFEADGFYKVDVGPPIIGPGQLAHFSGVLQGTALTVTIRTATTTIGPLTMQLGAKGNCQWACL
jgi:IPT/TIG domain